MRLNRPAVVLAAVLLTGIALLLHAGPLTPPPGAVSPTMKTLDEISTQISNLEVATGGVPIKRVVRGVMDVAAGELEKSQTFAPAIDPAKSVVLLSDYCATATLSSTNVFLGRTSACLINLTATQITVRLDASSASMDAKISYQIIEYN